MRASSTRCSASATKSAAASTSDGPGPRASVDRHAVSGACVAHSFLRRAAMPAEVLIPGCVGH
eukprot:7283511-Prymnesium_polylepis.1